jgi:hypothetical protein
MSMWARLDGLIPIGVVLAGLAVFTRGDFFRRHRLERHLEDPVQEATFAYRHFLVLSILCFGTAVVATIAVVGTSGGLPILAAVCAVGLYVGGAPMMRDVVTAYVVGTAHRHRSWSSRRSGPTTWACDVCALRWVQACHRTPRTAVTIEFEKVDAGC